MQGIPPLMVFCYQTITVFFPLFFKNHIVFQDQSEDCVGEDDIIDMTEVTALSSTNLLYVILC